MKKSLLFIFFCCAVKCDVCVAQAGEWTWIKGDSILNSLGNLGIQGIEDSANTPAGTYEGAEWTDLQGNFWLFGGVTDYNGDLWKYDPATNNWTWMKGTGVHNDAGSFGILGVPALTNRPPARGWGAATWIDLSGDLWLYGGAHGSNLLNDLWRYNIATNTWTWMNGSSAGNLSPIYGILGIPSSANTPGGRNETSATWVDSIGNLWMFGGSKYGYAELNDLWKYDITTNEWTWMSGSDIPSQVGSYGIKGIPDPGNVPGARFAYCSWKDGSGNFWLFGGGSGYPFNDMWMYNPLTNNWTWMSGTDTTDDPGYYESTCMPSINNLPASRMENRARWKDSCGKFWLYGGLSMGSNKCNDLWNFDPLTLEWTLVNGDSLPSSTAVYGTIGVSSLDNQPGGRFGAVSWQNSNGDLFLFGGHVLGVYHNDLWKFVPDPDCVGCILNLFPNTNFISSNTTLCEKFCLNFTDQSTNNPTAWQWVFNGASPSTSSFQNPTNICYNTPGVYDVTLIASNANGSDTLTLANYITVYAAPAPPIITQSNDTLTSSAAYSYQWFMSGTIIPAATNQLLIITQSGDYSVTITDSLGCSASDTIAAVLLYPQSAFNSNTISGCPGSCFDFTNASLNATSYQWFFTGANPASSTQQNPSNVCYANPGVFDVTLIASSNFSDDTLVQTGYITIFTPIAISISQNGNFLDCNPAAASYQWSLNGYQIPGATSQSLFINQTGTFTIEVIDSNGCLSFDTLIVNNVPSPNFAAADTTVCEKFCVNFTDQSTNNPASWQWQFPGGDPSSSTDQNPTNICYDVPGVYDVTLITTNANGNDTLTLHDYITVYPTPPFPTITQAGYTLTSSASSSYQWQFNSYDIPGATNQSYDVTQTGYYTVIVGDSNGCKNSATLYVLISGVDEVGDGSISISPNPSNGNFTVEFLNGFIADEVSIDVVNTLGQKVFSSEEKISSANFKKQIDLSNIALGVYFIEIKTENEFLMKKIVIE